MLGLVRRCTTNVLKRTFITCNVKGSTKPLPLLVEFTKGRHGLHVPFLRRTQTRLTHTVDENFEDDEALPCQPLIESITPEITEHLVGKFTSKKFKFKSIQSELSFLYKKGFPMPESLTLEQWEVMMKINSKESRTYYLDSLVRNVDELEEILADDAKMVGPLVVPPEILNNPNMSQVVQDVQLAHEKLRHIGEPTISVLDEDSWKEIISQSTNRGFVQSLRFFTNKRQKKALSLVEKRAKGIIGEQLKAAVIKERNSNEHLVYSLGNNAIFTRFYSSTIDTFENGRAVWSYFDWGQPIVIDLAYVNQMNFHEIKSLFFREIPHAVSYNRSVREPLALYIVNYNPSCQKCQLLKKAYSSLFDDDFPCIVSEKNYLDLFPHNRIVYLTPDSRTDLISHNPDDIYIVGGLVELGKDIPLTISTAKRMNIRHARLPTKRVLGISPTLNVDHVVSIMSDFTNTRDWFYSLRWIPSRIFRNRLKNDDFTSEMEQVYRAHHELSPSHNLNKLLTPKEYRAKYAEIMDQVDTSENFVPDSEKYRFKNKDEREHKKFGVLGESFRKR